MSPTVPRPGAAKLGPRSGLEEWLAEAKQCHYLPEWAMKQLCEMVKECLMEGNALLNHHFASSCTDPFPNRVKYTACRDSRYYLW